MLLFILIFLQIFTQFFIVKIKKTMKNVNNQTQSIYFHKPFCRLMQWLTVGNHLLKKDAFLDLLGMQWALCLTTSEKSEEQSLKD